jgi:S1-C subfamily serine protease
VIVSVDGKETANSAQLRSQIAVQSVGDEVALKLIRDGKTRTVQVQVGEPSEVPVASSDALHPLLEGVTFAQNPDGPGVVVSAMAANAPAAYSGLRPDDVIVGANRRQVADLKSFANALALNQEVILLQLIRGGRGIYLVIR